MSEADQSIGASLTPREREVLAMVAAGLTNREIGSALFISESTAGVHVSNLMAKLGVGSRTEAAAVAYRAGLVESVATLAGDRLSDSEGNAGDEQPPAGWFEEQVEHHPRRVALVGFGGLTILFLITVVLALAVLGEGPPVAGEGGDPTSSAQPNATASQTPRATPSSAPSASPRATPDSTSIGGAGVDLEIDGLARIVVDDLTLRSQPGIGARIGQLPRGALAFVVAGPVAEAGSVWYQLAAVDPFGAGCHTPQPPDSLVCRDWFGWAAAGGNGGEDWLAREEPTCPAPGVMAGLIALRPLEGLSCFGSAPMTLTAYMTANSLGHGCGIGWPVNPAWLGPCASVPVDRTEALWGGDTLDVGVAPSLGTCSSTSIDGGPGCPLAVLQGRSVEVVVHYDDPQARSCVRASGVAPEPDPAAIVLQCRAALVGTRITATDGLGTLDQREEAWTPEFPTGYQPHVSDSVLWSGVAQTFTAGRSGELTAVQLALNDFFGGSTGPLVVQLHRGGPDGELLAVSAPASWDNLPTNSAVCIPPQCLALDRPFAWVTVRFAQAAPVIAGQTYAIVLPSGPMTGSTDPTFFVGSLTDDAYVSGVERVRGPDIDDAWQPFVTGADLAFRTLVR